MKNEGFKNKEQESIEEFNEYIRIQEKINSELGSLNRERLTGNDNPNLLKNTEKDLKILKQKNDYMLSKLGLTLEVFTEVIETYEQSDKDDLLDIEAYVKLNDSKKFLYSISNLPNNFTSDNNKETLAYAISELLEHDIENFFKSGEISDNLLYLKEYSTPLSNEIKRIFKNKTRG